MGSAEGALRRQMDKKAKKRLEVLHQRIQKLRQQLAGAKQQADEPGEIEKLDAEIKHAEREIEKLKGAG
jgi:archaellum component FlaC